MSYSKGNYARASHAVQELNHFRRTVDPGPAISVTTRFLLWGYIKDNAHCNHLCNVNNLETNISYITANITLKKVSTNMLHCAQLRMQHFGVRFRNFLQQNVL